MIMSSEEFLHVAPFKDIVITGLVRDKQGRKMSKSLGNGVDPIEIIDMYGADAMKFTLCYMAAQGQDVLIDNDSFKMGSRFANKIWNATRFLLMNLEGRDLVPFRIEELDTMDKWIYSQLNSAARDIKTAMEGYRFNDAASAIYSFFWNDLCDWYIEASKQKLLHGSDKEKNLQISILMDILEKSMRLMHPFLSFITEEIYQKLPNHDGDVIVQSYPEYDEALSFEAEVAEVEALKDIVKSIRSLRSNLQIPPEKKLKAVLRVSSDFPALALIKSELTFVSSLVGAGSFIVDERGEEDTKGSVPTSGAGYECFLFVRDAIDVDAEIKKLSAEIEKAKKLLESSEKKLSNPQFVNNAKAEAVEKERKKKAEAEEIIEKSSAHIELLKSI